MTCAWNRRGNGQVRWKSPKLTSSIDTTATSCGAGRSPRTAKRASTVDSSDERSAPAA